MRAGQWESGLIVIECRRRPSTRAVALLAQSREPGGNVIRINNSHIVTVVAGVARRRSPCITSRVATVAGDRRMRPGQWESAEVMIE